MREFQPVWSSDTRAGILTPELGGGIKEAHTGRERRIGRPSGLLRRVRSTLEP